jgi:D-alanyl-D-alanine carboxypeptidase/D-alanyl-D-alanine-endopeptidase (penicillin-binding protein 4)
MSSDSLYKYMLSESDNFLAEQIMLMVSAQLTDTLSFGRSRDSVVERHLPFLKGKARWVDGSGLSRYNLQSPSNLVNTLLWLRRDFPEFRLKGLLPGYSFKAIGLNQWELERTREANASVFAKSGYVGNNYSLAGFLYTKKGEVLVFSVMQNHYLQPTVEIRRRVAFLLYQAYLGF